MLQGLYIGASAMKAQENKMDVVANNLANVDLNGYKRDVSLMKSFPEMLIRRSHDNGVYTLPIGSMDTSPIVGKLGMGVEYNETFTSFEQGSLKESSNDFDFALGNNSSIRSTGFFTIETPYGERYTRNGSFTLGKEGFLETKDGYRVMGENGPITVKENNFKVDIDGNILINRRYDHTNARELVVERDNEWDQPDVVDRFKIVHFYDIMGKGSERYLEKQGNSFWRATELSGPAITLNDSPDRPQILQGFIESSSVNAVAEMVNMITVNRAYEASQKTVQAADTSIEQIINKVLRS